MWIWVLMAVAPVAWGQAGGGGGTGGGAGGTEGPAKASTAGELLQALRAMGVELPEGLVAESDGSVWLPEIGELGGEQGGVHGLVGEMVPAGSAPPAPDADATPHATPPPETPEQEQEQEQEPEPEPEWKQRAEFALTLNDGNTESSNLRLAYKALRERDNDTLTLSAAYYRQTDSGSTSENRFMAEGNYDRDIEGTRWLWFVNGRYEWDQFESWDHRVGLSGGVGYRAIDREEMELILRAGGGFTKEFGSDRDELIPEGLLGYDFRWDLDERQGLESTFRYFPDFDQFGEFRTATTLGWHYALEIKDGLELNAGLLHEYQSQVDAGIEQSDLRLYAGVGFDF